MDAEAVAAEAAETTATAAAAADSVDWTGDMAAAAAANAEEVTDERSKLIIHRNNDFGRFREAAAAM